MVNRIFDTVTNSLSKFVLGWTIPSAVAVALFAVFDFPAVSNVGPFHPIQQAAVTANGLGVVVVFTLCVVALSALFAYSQLPIYRFLEGYSIPRPLRRRLHRRQLQRWYRLQLIADRPISEYRRQLLFEDQFLYPEDRNEVRATRLGNALRAAEMYGYDRFRLDSQTVWYELLATAPDSIRRDVEQTRAAIDLFVSSIAHFTLLAAASIVIAAWAHSWQALILGAISVLVLRPAYDAAVRNVPDLRYAVQALVHTGREPLADKLGFRMPGSISDERELWGNFCQFVNYGYGNDDVYGLWTSLDRFRRPPPTYAETVPI
jgi:hypothetical protein